MFLDGWGSAGEQDGAEDLDQVKDCVLWVYSTEYLVGRILQI